MSEWQVAPFDAVFRDESGGNVKTLQNEFERTGAYPIIDQGKELVAGYTNDEARLCKADLPVIIFGDHTRTFKYVEFAFCMGADGTKVLRPKIESHLKYLFHFLKSLKLPNEGYSRHFKFLKRISIPLPPLEEQRRIAAILDKAEALRAKRREAIARLDTLAQSIFLEMFGDPVENPKGWSLQPLADFISRERPITYGILMPGPDARPGIPYVRVLDMKNGHVDLDSIRFTTPEIANDYRRSTLRAGDVLLSIRGHVGRLATVPAKLDGANITQDTARLAVTEAEPVFIRECLSTPGIKGWMSRHTKGVAVKGINLGDVKRVLLPAPPREAQRQFSEYMTTNELLRDASLKSFAKLDALFASLQHRAFNAEL